MSQLSSLGGSTSRTAIGTGRTYFYIEIFTDVPSSLPREVSINSIPVRHVEECGMFIGGWPFGVDIQLQTASTADLVPRTFSRNGQYITQIYLKLTVSKKFIRLKYVNVMWNTVFFIPSWFLRSWWTHTSELLNLPIQVRYVSRSLVRRTNDWDIV